MKKRILTLFLGLLPISCFAQFTSVTATITDSDSQTWNNGKWTANLVNPRLPTPATINGVPLTAAQMNLSGSMSGSGVLTASMASNTVVVPAGTYWSFTICPNASSQCAVVNATVSGTTQNLSTLLSAGLAQLRFSASPTSYGYLDIEVTPTPSPGGQYYNVTNEVNRIWNGSAWTNGTGGGMTYPAAGIPNSSGSAWNSSYSTSGTGNVALTNSPVFVTPNLGVPSAIDLTNALNLPLTTGVTGILAKANGGNGTATPVLTAGTNVTITGTWPNYTINATGGGGGTPGGSNTQVQFNDSGAFGGDAGFLYNKATATATITHVIATDVTTGGGTTSTCLTEPSVGTMNIGASGAANDCSGNPTTGNINVSTINNTTIPTTATLTQTIASGTAVLGTSAIASGAKASIVTVTATGTLSTDRIVWNPNADISGVTGYGPSASGSLSFCSVWPTTNAVNFEVCNSTSGSITPGAVTVNFQVVR